MFEVILLFSAMAPARDGALIEDWSGSPASP
jgi:hypothetical protein